MSVPLLAPRRWWRILPLVFVTYSLAYLDRANYGIAAAAGMASDLHLTDQMSALLGAIFALGYCAFQVPAVVYAERHSLKRLVFLSLILWGACAALTGFVVNLPGLLFLRFALGVVEAAVFPAMLIYVSNWFTAEERSRANSFLILGGPATVLWMSVSSGYLVRAAGWRWMFVWEGVPAIAWAFVWWWLVDETPSDARWLSGEEKSRLAQSLDREQKKLKSVRNYREAFKSPAVILLSGQYFFWTMSFFGFVLWLPSLLREGSALGIVETGWLAATPYLLAMIAMPIISLLSDKTGRRKPFVWPCLAIGAVAFFALYCTGMSNFYLSFSLLVVAGGAMYAPYGTFWAMVPEILPRNVVGGAMALINSMGSLGAFVGAYAAGALGAAGGSASSTFLLMAGALSLAVVLTLTIPTSKQFMPSLPLVRSELL